jgi:hypothetical protein
VASRPDVVVCHAAYSQKEGREAGVYPAGNDITCQPYVLSHRAEYCGPPIWSHTNTVRLAGGACIDKLIQVELLMILLSFRDCVAVNSDDDHRLTVRH